MSSGMFQSMRDSIVSCFSSPTYEIVKTKVCKMYGFIVAVFLPFYCFYRRCGCIMRTQSTLYQRQVSRITNSASFRLLKSYIISFFRMTILVTTASLLASGLYYSFYDDSKAAVLSFLGIASSVLTRLIFQDYRNSAVLKFLELVALLLLDTGLLLLLIPRLWTTAFYPVCVGTIVYKIIFEMQEMTLLTMSYCPMDEARKQIKEYFKSASVQIVHYDSYLEHYNFETVNEKSDETKLSACEKSCNSAASSVDNREMVNSCNATIFSACDQDGLVQEACLFEDMVPVEISNAESCYSTASSADNREEVNLCKATIFSACDQDSLVQEACLFENMVPVKVLNAESCYSTASSVDNQEEVNLCNATIFSACDQDGLVQEACLFENMVPVKVSNVEKAVEQFKSNNSYYVSLFDACIAPPRKRYSRKLGKNEDPAAIETEESSVLNDDMASVYWKETEQNIHQSLELGSLCDGSINDNTNSEDTSLKTTVHTNSMTSIDSKETEQNIQRLVELGSLCDGSINDNTNSEDIPRRTSVRTNSMTSIYSKETEQNIHQRVELGSLYDRSINKNAYFENIYLEAVPHTNSIAKINFPILKIHKDNDFVDQTCFLKNSGEVPIRISNFDEAITGSSNYTARDVFSKYEYIAPPKKRYLKYFYEEEDHAIPIKLEESPTLSMGPIHANEEQGFGERIKPTDACDDAGKFNRSSDITQKSEEQTSGMYRCSSVSNIDEAKDMGISGDDFQELRNSTSEKTISMSFTHGQGILDWKDEVPVNNPNSDETTKQCSDCKAQYHVMSKHECFVSHKKQILRQYSDEENFSACKSELLTKFKSEDTTIPEPDDSLEITVNADKLYPQPVLSNKDNNSVNLQLKDDLAEAGRAKSNTRVSEEVSSTRQMVLQRKSNVDNVVNQIDRRFIYALL